MVTRSITIVVCAGACFKATEAQKGISLKILAPDGWDETLLGRKPDLLPCVEMHDNLFQT